MSVTILDMGFLALALISGLLAMYRGFSREMLSILSWIVAGAATYIFITGYPEIGQDLGNQFGQKPELVQIALGAVLFVLVLIIVHLITSRLSESILDSRIGMIDRILGLIFGVVRGALLLIILFILVKQVFPVESFPPWVKEAVSYEFINDYADSIAGFFLDRIPEDFTIPGTGGGDQSFLKDAPVSSDSVLNS
ncbi:MAG: CvpA family protein [Hyphomicrobiaceae bacterium]